MMLGSRFEILRRDSIFCFLRASLSLEEEERAERGAETKIKEILWEWREESDGGDKVRGIGIASANQLVHKYCNQVGGCGSREGQPEIG